MRSGRREHAAAGRDALNAEAGSPRGAITVATEMVGGDRARG